jgi:hypothetical protein
MLAEAQRLTLLQAIGIDVYRLRAAAAPELQRDVVEATAVPIRVLVICPRAERAGLARFAAQLPNALGLPAAQMRWRDAEDATGSLEATAYVALGTEAARALGVQLSTMQQNRTVIATTSEPAALLRGAAAKRALWHVLKSVARSVRSG